ncbi:MAG: hypothetical protein JKY66_03295 [Spongiibacteraceae bacterium]|nr:hypothetical protein [Spongiibacteraceae bacterium]
MPALGERPFSDYIQGDGCSHNNCDRRAAYLKAAVQLLVDDLEIMVQHWKPAQKNNYRTQLLAQDATQGLSKMLLGMGSLSLGELAGERMKVSLEANSPEDEHDCFSDNTHHSHYYDALGIQNIYLGQYRRPDGSLIKGASLSDLVAASNKNLDQQVQAALSRTITHMQVLVNSAERSDKPMKFDQMIAEGNPKGKKIITDAIKSLVDQTRQLEKMAKVVGITNLNPDTADHTF